jgi:uncharacterized protein YbaR (Trm112 family)
MNEVSSTAESADEPILQCPTCRSQLSLNSEVSELDENCPVCRAKINLHVFPRLYWEPVEKSVPRLSDGTEAKCNFYPELAAEKVCDECGCFLSEKAAVRWGNLDLCLALSSPTAGREKIDFVRGALPAARQSRAGFGNFAGSSHAFYRADCGVYSSQKSKEPLELCPARESPLVDCHDPRDFVDRSLDGSAGGLEFL